MRCISSIFCVQGSQEPFAREVIPSEFEELCRGENPENLSGDGSFVEANASKECRIPRQQLSESEGNGKEWEQFHA